MEKESELQKLKDYLEEKFAFILDKIDKLALRMDNIEKRVDKLEKKTHYPLN